MIKDYYIESDPTNDKSLYVKLNLSQKNKEVLKGNSQLIHINDFFEIWKVLLPYELKLVLIKKESSNMYRIIESIAVNPSKAELLKMQAEFNTTLKSVGINFMGVEDKNNY